VCRRRGSEPPKKKIEECIKDEEERKDVVKRLNKDAVVWSDRGDVV
jgi:hypothetical protein